MADSDAKDRTGAGDEWYLYLPSNKEPVQPYRTAHTVWPLSAGELSRTESQAQSGNASALNNLGTTQHSARGWRSRNPQLCCRLRLSGRDVLWQEQCICSVGVSGPSIATKRTTSSAAHSAPALRPPPTTEQCANGSVTAAKSTKKKLWLCSTPSQSPFFCDRWLWSVFVCAVLVPCDFRH
jgi:hypothetical protein